MHEPPLPMPTRDAAIAAAGSVVPTWPRRLIALLSPLGRRARLAVLIFHRVGAAPDPLFPNEMHASAFRERMRWIREWFEVLPLDEAVGALARGALPARALAISFDDGYADNAEVALPILRELGLCATFFVTSGYVDGGRMWNDTLIEAIRRTALPALDLSRLGLGVHPTRSNEERRGAIATLLPRLKHLAPGERQACVDAVAETSGAALQNDLMMTGAQLRALAGAGMGIGAHTVSHPILATLDEAAARSEIAEGREQLEAIVRQPVRLFAYPNGRPTADYRAIHVELAKSAGFAAAFSTSAGAARGGDSPFELPRFTPWDRTATRWAMRMAHNLRQPIERAAP